MVKPHIREVLQAVALSLSGAPLGTRIITNKKEPEIGSFFFWMKGPRTTALRVLFNPVMKMKISSFLPSFTSNGAPVE
jgi:hypothetical protein